MKRVLVTEPIHEDGINLLSAREDVKVIRADNPANQLVSFYKICSVVHRKSP